MLTAAELAIGRKLRDAERGETWHRPTTYALSDWLDRHCDDLLEAAGAPAALRIAIAQLPRYQFTTGGALVALDDVLALFPESEH